MSGKVDIHYDIQTDVKEVSITHPKPNQSIKIMFVGTSSVGKSHIINSFIDDMTLLDHQRWSLNHDPPPTKTIEFYTKDVKVIKGITDSDYIVNLLILDTPPNKDDEKIILNCRTVDFIVFTYDVSDFKSFENLNSFIDSLSSSYRDRDKPVNLFILGNIKTKSRHQRSVTYSDALEFSSYHEMDYFEVEGKDDILKFFSMMTNIYITNKKDKKDKNFDKQNSKTIDKHQINKESWCCLFGY